MFIILLFVHACTRDLNSLCLNCTIQEPEWPRKMQRILTIRAAMGKRTKIAMRTSGNKAAAILSSKDKIGSLTKMQELNTQKSMKIITN